MLIRHILRRQARRTLTTNAVPFRRFISTEVDATQASFDNGLKEARAIETQVDNRVSASIPSINSQISNNYAADHVIAENYHIAKQQSKLLGHIGTAIEPHYQPHTLVTNPPSPADVTLELLLASEAHQGHSTSLWNPANSKYIFGVRDGIHIISLEATAAYLRRAAKVVTEVTRRGGLILFVGTRAGQDRCVVKAAELSGGCHLFERWVPGSITNGQQILGRCKMRVVDEFDQEVSGFEEQLEDRAAIKPDLVVCLNPLENYVLLHECGLHNIPTIGIIDTNADPTWVTYPIPANDDSLRCVQVIAGVLGRAGEAGRKLRLEAAKSGKLTFNSAEGLILPNQENASEDAEIDDSEKV